jgi:hypothetical protein
MASGCSRWPGSARGHGGILELAGLDGGERYPWLRPGDTAQIAVEQLGVVTEHITPGVDPVPLIPN